MEAQHLIVGNEIVITEPITGYIKDNVKELKVDNRILQRVNRGDQFAMSLNEKIRASDKIYKLVAA